MKNLIFLFIIVLAFYGCIPDSNDSLDSPVNSEKINVESTNVKSFQVITISVTNTQLLESYSGLFAETAVSIVKTDENTLAFAVPDIGNGKYNLQFDLGTIEFTVTETTVLNTEELISNVFENFDTEISNLNNTSPLIAKEIQNAQDYRLEVQNLYSSLSNEEKRQVALFYTANKEVFKTFKDNLYTNLDATTVFSKTIQSNCPKNEGWKAFYSCTAKNLGGSSKELARSAVHFITFLTLAGISVSISPATLGVGIAAAGLAVAASAYILFAEILPATIKFKNDLRAFLYANWVPVKATFLTIIDEFSSNTDTSLDLEPKFRSVNNTDKIVSNETGLFINSLSTLNESWDKLKSLFGELPDYQGSSEIIPFNKNDKIIISKISNPNVELVSQNGQFIKFKSISGEDETFSYTHEVFKEGFVEISTVIAIVYKEKEIDLSGVWIMKYTTASCSIGGDNIEIPFTSTFIFNSNNTITFVGNSSSDNDGVISINEYLLVNTTLSINFKSLESGYSSDICNGISYDFSVDFNLKFNGSYKNNTNEFIGNYSAFQYEIPSYPCVENDVCNGSMKIYRK
ncbi:hypothetical protein JQC67_16015 [Aurantibacter crassamenti]|uniref:hypothetical protein n=1 Tax=Aurantibacter crassamenti TaxID=1837375 RepID=UPI00193AAA8C|nr:hypothetical protein [Aurantibacter crassamenti]MBM1107663.1 hypothetical protein [Aurantibacter crassamenti]